MKPIVCEMHLYSGIIIYQVLRIKFHCGYVALLYVISDTVFVFIYRFDQ